MSWELKKKEKKKNRHMKTLGCLLFHYKSDKVHESKHQRLILYKLKIRSNELEDNYILC